MDIHTPISDTPGVPAPRYIAIATQHHGLRVAEDLMTTPGNSLGLQVPTAGIQLVYSIQCIQHKQPMICTNTGTTPSSDCGDLQASRALHVHKETVPRCPWPTSKRSEM